MPAHRTAGRDGEALPFGEGEAALAADGRDQVEAAAGPGGPGQMLKMLVHLFFRNGETLGELQRGIWLFLEQLLQSLTYSDHVKPALPQRTAF